MKTFLTEKEREEAKLNLDFYHGEDCYQEQDSSFEIAELFDKYQGDLKAILKGHSDSSLLNQLSPVRENVWEWFDFNEAASLLEIGAGLGALTGMFCSKVSQVVALESNKVNASINHKRHRGCKNLEVVAANIADFSVEDRFDYVVLTGILEHAPAYFHGEDPYGEMLCKAKSLLKPDGVLLAAVDNQFGLKYFAGAPERHSGAYFAGIENFRNNEASRSFSGPGFQAMLSKAGFLNSRFYYPVPDYRLPVCIYSQDYLPHKGEIGNVSVAYDWERYQMFDEEAAYDALCEAGQFPFFANSFLAVCRAGEEQKEEQQVLYAKYNRTRRDEFQIKTAIYRQSGNTYVDKAALMLTGRAHIESFVDKYEKIRDMNPGIRVLKPEVKKNGMTYPFLRGESMAEALGKTLAAEGEAAFLKAVFEGLDKIFTVRPEYETTFSVTPGFEEVFCAHLDGSGTAAVLFSGEQAYTVSNVDGLFENMMLTEDGVYCLDYEWVFAFPIPVGFLKYRNLSYLHQKYKSQLQEDALEAFLKCFGIRREQRELYDRMETSFQEYVHGAAEERSYMENYQKPVRTFEEVLQADEALKTAKDRILQLQDEINEKNLNIRKVQEVQRLTNNHVTNLEVMIADLRREIGVQAETLAYLNRHESLIFKVLRRMKRVLDRLCPPGTRKRKVLKYAKRTLRHPVKMVRLYTTREGRNRISGDFKIGESYFDHGKLVLPKTEHPTVSIVIPVYNQVHYTYACLLSILENTKDVEYEVIIADDVSTDATAQLGEYVENLVICRNQTNQGFLRNCNQAARAARGKYVMFLNNDTQVHENWLSSLVSLIESDTTIGMVGSKLVYPDGRLQEAGGILWSDGSGWNYGRLDDPGKAEYNYVKDVDYISGAAILLSVDLWKQIGGFDERFAPAYCEDSDLAFEVRKAGYRVVYQPLSVVTHFEGISNGTDVNGTGLKRYQVENSKKLREKWADEFKRQCVNDGNPNPFRARERSMGKQVILVVDHYVPTYDRDAGSKTTWQYLKMFLKKGFVVKFIGDNYLHEEPYTTALQQLGIEVLYGTDYQVGIWDWIKKNKDEIAFAYLNRPHIATKYIDFIKDNTDIKIIYYGHDLHFLREGREYELTGDLKKKRDSDYWRAIEMSLMYKADMSYYPSYVERDAIKAVDGSIRVKDITAYVYEEFIGNMNMDFAKREGLLFVGGFAHPPNADAVLWFAQEIYPLIRERMNASFYIVGSKVTPEIQALEQPGNGIVVKGFVSEEELAQLYQSCRIVVVPLRYGAGVKGKVIEALYNGAPIVTTAIGAEGIPYAEDILVVEDEPAAFAGKVCDLYQDVDGLKGLCEKSQEFIKKFYSLDAAWRGVKEDFTR